jgi:F-type H+-transporting ATPase subunit d
MTSLETLTPRERESERARSRETRVRSFSLAVFLNECTHSPIFCLFPYLSLGGGSLFKTLTKTRARSIKQQQVSAIQQQQRLFSADAVQSTDASSWDTAIAANATEETKRELASLAKTMADIKDAVQRDADRSTEIDFAKFKQQLTNSPEIVDLFQKAYSTLKLPKYESTEIADVTQAFKVLEEAAKKQAAESAKRIEELEKELVALKEERESLERVTMDEIFEREPEMREKFNEQIKKDEWF